MTSRSPRSGAALAGVVAFECLVLVELGRSAAAARRLRGPRPGGARPPRPGRSARACGRGLGLIDVGELGRRDERCTRGRRAGQRRRARRALRSRARAGRRRRARQARRELCSRALSWSASASSAAAAIAIAAATVAADPRRLTGRGPRVRRDRDRRRAWLGPLAGRPPPPPPLVPPLPPPLPLDPLLPPLPVIRVLGRVGASSAPASIAIGVDRDRAELEVHDQRRSRSRRPRDRREPRACSLASRRRRNFRRWRTGGGGDRGPDAHVGPGERHGGGATDGRGSEGRRTGRDGVGDRAPLGAAEALRGAAPDGCRAGGSDVDE